MKRKLNMLTSLQRRTSIKENGVAQFEIYDTYSELTAIHSKNRFF